MGHAESVKLADQRRQGVWRWVVVVGIVLSAGGGVWYWSEYKYEYIPKRFGVVKEGLIYRSGQLSASLVKEVLEEHQIRVIADLTGESPDDPHQAAEAQAARELGIMRMKFPLKGDGTGDIQQYANALTAIRRAELEGKPVLVHCAAGAQRTGGVVAAYRLLFENRPVEEAIEEMGQYDWDPEEDVALPRYLNEQMPTLVKLLVDRGVLEKAPQVMPEFKGYN